MLLLTHSCRPNPSMYDLHFSVGKAAALKKLKVSEYYKENVKCLSEKIKDQLLNTGSEIVSYLYGSHPNEGLDFLKYREFGTKLAVGSIAIQCQSLQSTSYATSFCSDQYMRNLYCLASELAFLVMR